VRGDPLFGVSSDVKSSTIVTGGRERGGGRGDGRGRDSGGGRSSGDKGRHCIHFGRNNHTSNKCWDNYSKPEWAQIVDSTITSATTSSIVASAIKISQVDYDHYLQLQIAQASQCVNSTMHGSASVTSLFTASFDKS